MRLHRLSVQAFGPFAGSERVDFDQLAADGLFLLHGRTGAGKTSVLDAVCFALYGAVPGARSGGAPDLRSHHAAPELAPVVELELTAGGRRLRVERSPAWTRPKRRGEGTTTEQARTLLAEWAPGAPDAGSDGWRPLSSRNDEASQVLTDVLGMGLAQFATVVLLPQGEFATFLRSGVADRRALLQRLFSTDRYERAERWLVAERTRTAAAHQRAAARLAAPAERAEQAAAEWSPAQAQDAGASGAAGEQGPGAAGEQDAEVHARATEGAPGGQEPREVLARVRQLAEAVDRAALRTEAERVAAGAAAREAAALEHRCRQAADRARRAAEVREQQRQLAQAAPAVERQRAELAAATAAHALEGHLQALATARAAAEDAERRAGAAAARLAAAAGPPGQDADGPQVSAAPGAPEHLRELAARHRLEQGRLAELVELEADAARRQEQARQVAAEHDRLARIQSVLRERLEAGARARTDLVARVERCAAGAAGAEEAAAALGRALRVHEHATSAERLEARCEDARRRADEAATAATEARARWLDARQARWEQVAAELAAQLRPGGACPVCGSCDHPDPAGRPSQGGTPARHDQPALAGPPPHGSPDGSPDGSASRPATAAAAEEAAQAAFERAESAERSAQQALTELEREAAAARGLAGGTSATDAAHQVEQARQRADLARAAQADLAAARSELAAAEAAQAADGSALEAASSGLVRLAERTEQLAAGLARDRARLQAAGGAEGLAVRSSRLADLAAAAEDLAAAAEAEASARAGADGADASARAAAVRAGFPDLTAARQALRDARTRQELQGAVAAHERATAALEAQLAEVVASQHRDGLPSDSGQTDSGTRDGALVGEDAGWDADRAVAAVADAARRREQADRAEEAAVRAAERAATSARLLERTAAEAERAVAALEPLAHEARVADDLARCAEGTGGGNARRMKLSTYVLAARLEQVAHAASERLEVMSDGRYRLAHSDALERRGAGSGLGLRVLDGWTGVERDVATLSGGETFMASLALALGLAEVVRAEGGGAPVETLFVDEGFGTLDPESLEEVMGVLEQLRAGGRAVGLVSHVPELRTRVPARLEVLRTATGSRLTTVLA
ncbi:AAA family ATPase [Quadrisphaera sp. KR29]|uniref:AAA family ATPase n=1 Tax=Quadrisphaera sp. KR29 TaxID=3461391 RepID=UPI0040444F92